MVSSMDMQANMHTCMYTKADRHVAMPAMAETKMHSDTKVVMLPMGNRIDKMMVSSTGMQANMHTCMYTKADRNVVMNSV